METVYYEPDLGIEGTLTELVDWANKYTNDYSDPALKRISELAELAGRPEKDIQIPLLLIDERKREYESDDNVGTPYERMKIDKYIFGRISYFCSDGKGGETEIWDEDDKIIISISGTDDDGSWHAVGSCSVEEFMKGEYDWLDKYINSILYYTKTYNED